jgi:hypothetical protein
VEESFKLIPVLLCPEKTDESRNILKAKAEDIDILLPERCEYVGHDHA